MDFVTSQGRGIADRCYRYHCLSISVIPESFYPTAVYRLPDPFHCMVVVIGWTYGDLPVSKPQYYQHFSNAQRNCEIVRRYLGGESSGSLAHEFGISDRRVRFIVQRDLNSKSSKTR
jgi:hypothetical protein